MTEQEIKQVLFTCKSQAPGAEVDPAGLYCDNLDVLEFGGKIAHKERAACIAFVKSIDRLAATALEADRKKAPSYGG